MNNKVLYLGYYDDPLHKRTCSPAAVTMMNYVAESIRKSGFDPIIISAAQSQYDSPYEECMSEENVLVIYLESYRKKEKIDVIRKLIDRKHRKTDLYNALKRLLKENNTLIAYHSMAYIDVLSKLRNELQFNLILQVCEIYSDVVPDEKKRRHEIDWINSADGYIFSTEEMVKQFDLKGKKYAICYGTYKTSNDILTKKQHKENGIVNVIYAGTLDPIKGGGVNALQAARFLPSNYHLHICGFGTPEQISNIEKNICNISDLKGCTVTYDGCFFGEKYINELQKCDIGLCTQNIDAKFNSSSFPSKILSYISNGLQVVSARIPAIENSAIGSLLTFYDTQSPEKIASAILSVDVDNDCKEGINMLIKLDKEFCLSLKTLLIRD